MSICRSIYNDIINIEFFKDDSSVIEFRKPFVVYDPLITVGADSTDSSLDCIIKSAPEFTALIHDMSGTMTVNSSTDLPGTKYKITIEYDMEWIGNETNNSEYKRQLVALQNANYHLRITYFGGAKQIVRTDESSWMFSFKENKGKVSITIVMENISGAQRVV